MHVGTHRRLVDLATLAAFALIVVVLAGRLLPALADDSFIYLRVAANVAGGEGWLYNPGEHANPATSVLYTLVVTAIGALAGFGAHTLVIAWSATLFALLCVHYLAWRESDGWTIAVTITLGAGLGARLLGAVGMETALLLALVSATALAYRRHGDGWQVGLLAGLTALTRPEGIFVLAVIGLLELARRRIAWRSALVAALSLLPWLAFATWAFGSALSHTAAVKAAQRSYGWWATRPDFLTGFLQQPRWLWLTLGLAAAGLAVAWLRARKQDEFAFICITFGLLQVLGYHALGAPLGYNWYFAPGNFAVDLAILLAGTSLARHLALRTQQATATRAIMACAALAMLFSITRIGMAPSALPGPRGLSADYRSAAGWLHAHATPADTVAATEIGYFGWYSGLRVLDIHGLLHPRALPSLRAGNLHWWYDHGEHPRFVLTHVPAWHGEPGSRETWPEALSADFAQRYRTVYDEGALRIHERR